MIVTVRATGSYDVAKGVPVIGLFELSTIKYDWRVIVDGSRYRSKEIWRTPSAGIEPDPSTFVPRTRTSGPIVR